MKVMPLSTQRVVEKFQLTWGGGGYFGKLKSIHGDNPNHIQNRNA